MMKFDGDIERTRLVTHVDCCDGAGCAVVFLEAGGKRDNIRYVQAGKGMRRLLEIDADFFDDADFVIFADISCDEGTADTIEKYYGDCVLIDHHKSALHLQNRDWCHIDVSKCGSMLLYDYFADGFDAEHGDLYRFCELINDQDMWILKEEFSDEIQLYMNFYGQERFVDRACIDLFSDGWEYHEGEVVDVLKQKREECVKRALERVMVREMDGKRLGYVFISDHQSMVLNRVIEEFNCDAAVGIMMDKCSVSMRALGAMDVSEFCEEYGGGGHANAAGHRVSDWVMREIMEVIHP